MRENKFQNKLGYIDPTWGCIRLTSEDWKSYTNLRLDLIKFIESSEFDYTKGQKILQDDINLYLAQKYYVGIAKRYVYVTDVENGGKFNILLYVTFRNELYNDKCYCCMFFMEKDYLLGISGDSYEKT